MKRKIIGEQTTYCIVLGDWGLPPTSENVARSGTICTACHKLEYIVKCRRVVLFG